jgi:DNA-binding MarR family transcriptional regulator
MSQQTDHQAKIARSIRKGKRFCSAVRSGIAETVPVQLVHTLYLVADNEGKGVVELAELAGATKATMSRHLLDLSDKLRNGDEGYGLLQRTQDPKNLRSVAYTLTPKGKLLLNTLAEILED